MPDSHWQLDVAAPCPSRISRCDFDSAPVADHPLVLDAPKSPAKTLIVADGTEECLVEKCAAVMLGAVGAGRPRPLQLAERPGAHVACRGDAEVRSDVGRQFHHGTP